MIKCDYCSKKIEQVLPHKCKFCGLTHCHNHLLPESHYCVGLEQHKKGNLERWKKGILQSRPINYYSDVNEGLEKLDNPKPVKAKQNIKQKFSDKIKSYLIDKYENFGYWLRKREHHKYDFEGRLNHLIVTILFSIASIVGLAIFYSNAPKLNEIDFWIIKLGGVLILTSLFFTIKFGWRLGKEILNIFKRQRNWLKYLIVILIAFFLWSAYIDKDTILDPVFDIYNKINFSLSVPINLGNFSFESNSNPLSTNSDANKEGNSWFDSNSDRDVGEIEQEILILVNEERQRNGVRALSAKSNLNSFARSWSEKMISQNFFEHSNLDFPYPSIAGENIGETPVHYNVVGCGSTYTNYQMAECFVSGWISSYGHHENMISKSFSMTGVGVACDSSKCRATQVFSG